MAVNMDPQDGAAEPTRSETVGRTGMTVAELAAYLDAGRVPRVQAVEEDAEAQAVLDQLSRLTRLSRELIASEAGAAGRDSEWYEALLSSIRFDSRAGEDIPYEQFDPNTSITITEGALRGLVRAVGDRTADLIVSRTRHTGELVEPSGSAGTIGLTVSVSALWGVPMFEAAQTLRAGIAEAVAEHTPLSVASIDIVVEDVHLPLEAQSDGFGGAESDPLTGPDEEVGA